MSAPSYFSPVAKILVESGYVSAKQMRQAIAQFYRSGRAIAQGGLSLIEILESITKQPLPTYLRHHLVCDFSSFSSAFVKQLIQSGYATDDQMQRALAETRESGRSLVEILESITKHPFPPDLLRQSKKQLLFELTILFGVQALDPEINQINSDQMYQLIDTLISIDICRRYQLVPLSKQETHPPLLLVAMVDPDNLEAQDDLNRILRPQGIGLQRMVITQGDYQQLITVYLDEHLKKQQDIDYQKSVDVSQDLESLELNLEDSKEEVGKALVDVEGKPVINLVNRILTKALQEGVSDIHIEPQKEVLRIRFRKDGVLRQPFDPLPKKITPAVSARFKIMAGLDITEREIPQNGKIQRMFQGRKVEFSIRILPSYFGETIVLRLSDNGVTQFGLDKLVTNLDTLQMIREMANRPFGLILVSGSTGSGKSTTLYSILAERNDLGVKICTVEDPVEYPLPGITQVEVHREKGIDFASILESFFRQDPDVIMVSQIWDKKTAKLAIEAALIGHLAVTVLHANNSAGTITRLVKMGIEPFMLADALIGVISQRLMRRVCSECRISYHPTAAELARFGLSAASDGEMTLYKANTLRLEAISEARSRDTLCQNCYGIGYRGRVAVYEVMCVSEAIRTLITEGASLQRIQKAAIDEGMTTLFSYSLDLVQQGYTTLDEVERVTFTDSGSGMDAELKAKRRSSLTPPSSPDAEAQSTNPLQRLQSLEGQLETLTHQFQELKKELET